MLSSLWIFLELITVGFVAFLSAYTLQRLRHIKEPFVSPERDTILRLVIGRKVTRVRFDSEFGPEWILQTPISKDEAPDVVLGMAVYGSFGSSLGVVRFRSAVLKVSPEGKICISAPTQTLVQERRSEVRIQISIPVLFERIHSYTLDLSPLGGKFATPYRAELGERVRVDLAELPNPVFAWVLDPGRSHVRVQFEERIDLDYLQTANFSQSG